MDEGDSETEAIRAAVADERSHIGTRVNGVRIAAIAGWTILAVALGYGGRPEWRTPLPALVVWLSLALLLWRGARRARARSLLWLVVPLVDVPLVGVIQASFVDVSIRPQAVAIFTTGILAALVFVSQLAFSLVSVLLTLVGAFVCSVVILQRANLPLPNLLAAALLLVWAASVAVFSGARVNHLIVSIATSRRSKEKELAELVALRTQELTERNQELSTALVSVAKAQSELVRSERMASIATLVQGIAHELNNPIGYIANNIPPLQRYIEFLRRTAVTLSDGAARSSEDIARICQLDRKHDLAFVTTDLVALTEDVAEGARRAKLIVGDLQRLTSNAGRSLEVVELERIVRHTAAMFGPRLSSRVTLVTSIEPVPRVLARAGELEQLLVNLVDNALRAVGDEGEVAVSVALDDDRVKMSVKDNGCGMRETDRLRAFEPFFTTRAAGEGAGLGLAIAASIVQAHGGELAIVSEPGRGTEVVARLPFERAR